MSIDHAEVLIVGAGPAGLAAALELKRLGINDVLVVDREPEPGGIPRLCHHPGFGLQDLRWVHSGPSYAQHYVRAAERAGVKLQTATTVTGWQGPTAVTFTSPGGLGRIEARAILLATGCRERPRSARLVPGRRPAGIFTTGSLQRFVYQHHLPVGRRAVIVGAELVSLSALMTLAHAGVAVAAMVTDQPRHQIDFPYRPAKWLFADLLARTPVLAGVNVSDISGGKRVEGVELTQLATGHTDRLACDTVVFTGDWIPEHELARLGGIALNPGTRGPQVDADFHTSAPGVFAAGNLLRGAETADTCALEGTRVAGQIHQYLATPSWPEAGLPIHLEPPLQWVFPNVVRGPGGLSTASGFLFRVQTFCRNMQVHIHQGQRRLHTQSFRHCSPNNSWRLDGRWVKDIQPGGEALRASLQPA